MLTWFRLKTKMGQNWQISFGVKNKTKIQLISNYFYLGELPSPQMLRWCTKCSHIVGHRSDGPYRFLAFSCRRSQIIKAPGWIVCWTQLNLKPVASGLAVAINKLSDFVQIVEPCCHQVMLVTTTMAKDIQWSHTALGWPTTSSSTMGCIEKWKSM